MAGLLLAAAVGALTSGCLIPQDDQVILDLPPKANRPIKIVSQEPVQRLKFANSTTCASQNPAFRLTAEDADVADVVYSMWFIDQGPDAQKYEPNIILGGTSPRREVTAPNLSAFRSALANLNPGTHLLTAYVADWPFLEPVDGKVGLVSRDETLADGGVLKDKGSFDSFTWVLDVEPCP